MSREEMGTKSIPCPCGKSLITRTDYMDDWNRYDAKYFIECPDCRAKYKFMSRSHYKHAGNSWSDQYLLSVDYPVYEGTKLADVFPSEVNIYDMPFDEFLIRSYPSESLKKALFELKTVTVVSRLTETAASIAKEHKRIFHSAKISVLRSYVESACNKYEAIPDNKDKRIPVELKEQEERSAYDKKMRKHLILIPL